MAFPRKNLNSYEEVTLDMNPHWWFMVEPLATLAGVIILAVLLEIFFDVTFFRWLYIALFVVAGIWTLWRILTWKSTYFVVTTDRLIYQAGVFAKRGIQMPLERLNNVNFHQTFIERMLGTGDLLIESGGEQGQQRFTDIKHPDQVQNLIHAQVEANENRKFGLAGSMTDHNVGAPVADQLTTPLPPPPPAAAPDVVSQLEKLEGLLERGAISPDEYAQQKARLLQ